MNRWSPASRPAVRPQEQGIQIGDRVRSINGHHVYLVDDISFFLEQGGKMTVDLGLSRNGEKIRLEDFALSALPAEGGGHWVGLGITTTQVENTLPELLKISWFKAADCVRLVWYSLSELVRGAVGLREMSGPVGIVDMVGQVGEEGAQAAQEAGMSQFLGAMLNILSLTSFIAINLAVMNLLPIPALDGGQILLWPLTACTPP